MKTHTEIVANLKDQISMNNFGYIRALMHRRRNFHFFAQQVKKPERAYFDFSEQTGKWSDQYRILPDKDRDGNDLSEVVIDLHLFGKLCEYNSKGHTYSEKPITLDLGIRAFIYDDGWVNFENIYLMNDEQRALTHFQDKYLEELRRTGQKTIAEVEHCGKEAFDFFTGVWKNVDNNNQKMVDGTSLDYFHEFVEANRNVIFHVSCANMWGRYTSHYADHVFKHESREVFPRNPTVYDTRYTIFLETAMEDLYSFYERCAYFTYIFLQPPTLRDKDVSYSRLFDKKVTKSFSELRPELASNPNWLWFTNRLKKEHKILSGFRHPLIHYQDENTFIRGSYGAAQTRLWMKSAMGDAKGMEDLSKRMDDILKFLNQELPKCHEAFVNVVKLCESLIPLTNSSGSVAANG